MFRADRYLENLERLRDQNSSNAECVSFPHDPLCTLTKCQDTSRWTGYIAHEFRDLGIPVSTQSYHFTNASGVCILHSYLTGLYHLRSLRRRTTAQMSMQSFLLHEPLVPRRSLFRPRALV